MYLCSSLDPCTTSSDAKLTFLDTRLQIHVHSQHVFTDRTIPLLVGVVRNNKQQIETREQRIRQRNVSVWVFMHIVLEADISIFPQVP